jgi:hypothetical protein
MRGLCESELHAQQVFGMPAAADLLGLLADLLAADNLEEPPTDRVRTAWRACGIAACRASGVGTA